MMAKIPIYFRLRPSETEPLVTATKNGLSIGDEIFIQSEGVFSHISQSEIFEKVGRELVASALRGVNSTILTTGGSASGKTYSLFGNWSQSHEIGILPRIIEELFRNFDSKTQIFLSSFEVTSSDRIFDLLLKRQEGDVMLDGEISNISSYDLDTIERAFNCLKIAQRNKSKTSHHVSIIDVVRHDEEAGEIVKSRLQFVDLASGENSISASRQLSLLEHVLIALSSKQRDHVPYRQCKLTHSLQRALDQRSQLILLCTIRPEAEFIAQTLATVRFASRAARIPISEPKINSAPDPITKMSELENEVKSLKRELSFQSLLNGATSHYGETPSANQIKEAKSKIDTFLTAGQIPQIESYRQLQAIFAVFKQSLVKEEKPKEEILPRMKGSARSSKSIGRRRDQSEEKGDTVSLSRPSRRQKDEIKKEKKEERKSSKPTIPTPTKEESPIPEDIVTIENNVVKEERPDRETAYKIFKAEEGRELARILRESEETATEKEKLALEIALQCNQKIQKRKEIKNTKFGSLLPDGREIIDEDELEKLKSLKVLKKEIFEDSKKYDIYMRQAGYCREQAQKTAERILEEFDQWIIKTFN